MLVWSMYVAACLEYVRSAGTLGITFGGAKRTIRSERRKRRRDGGICGSAGSVSERTAGSSSRSAGLLFCSAASTSRQRLSR